jgi:hypothetical protein
LRRVAGVTLILAGLLLVSLGIAGAITWGNADLAASTPILVGTMFVLVDLLVTAVGWAVIRDLPRQSKVP